jgi:hypothetical protein
MGTRQEIQSEKISAIEFHGKGVVVGMLKPSNHSRFVTFHHDPSIADYLVLRLSDEDQRIPDSSFNVARAVEAVYDGDLSIPRSGVVHGYAAWSRESNLRDETAVMLYKTDGGIDRTVAKLVVDGMIELPDAKETLEKAHELMELRTRIPTTLVGYENMIKRYAATISNEMATRALVNVRNGT